MDNEQYLQALQMQQMQQEMQKRQMQQGFNPMNPSSPQIDTVRQSAEGAGGNRSMLHTIGKSASDMMRNFGVGMLRGNVNPQLKAMGEGMRTPVEEETENFRIMEFLQKAEEAKRMNEQNRAALEQRKLEHEQTLAETKRYHSMQNSHWANQQKRESAYDKKIAAEEKKNQDNDSRNAELQQTNPGAVYLSTLPKVQQTSDLKAQSKYLEGEDAAHNSMKSLRKIKKLYEDNPGLGEVSTYALSKNGEIPIYMPWVSKKLKTAVSRLKTYTSELKLHRAQGLGNKGNQTLDRWIADSKVGLNMTDDAAHEIIDEMYQDARESYYGRKNVRRDKQKGIIDESSRYRIPPMPDANGIVTFQDNDGELREFNIKDDEGIDQAMRFGWTSVRPEQIEQ